MKLRYSLEEWHETKMESSPRFTGRVITHVTHTYTLQTPFHTPIDLNEANSILDECRVDLPQVKTLTLSR